MIVIGAGVNGLSAAWQAARRGAQVRLLERFELGHDRGSSHGASRITRSTYPSTTYVRLATQAHAEEWPRLEQDAGRRLLHPVTGCFFGAASPSLTSYIDAVQTCAAGCVDVLDVESGRERFPTFAFPDADTVLADSTSALVAAADTMTSLAACAVAQGVTIQTATRVAQIESRPDAVHVRTDRGTLSADRVIVASGAWAAQLVPAVAGHVTVQRQDIGYFRLETTQAAQELPTFPVWANIADDSLHYYGLPAFGGGGVKAARHHVRVGPDDPNATRPPDLRRIAEVREFLAAQLSAGVAELLSAETCLYTTTCDEDFVIDLHPDDPRIVVAAGFSGHGFKFGPLTGRLLAELALEGRTTVSAFESDRARFAIR